jgi:hypothetical protein
MKEKAEDPYWLLQQNAELLFQQEPKRDSLSAAFLQRRKKSTCNPEV